MNKNIYIDINGAIYQYITTAYLLEGENKYVVYQELKPNFKCYIILEDKFYSDFTQYDIEANTEELKKIDEIKNYKQIEPQTFVKETPEISLMAFLDAETISEKINILNSLRSIMNESIITNIELSLDMAAGFGDIDTRIDAVKKTLQMHEKYEGRRLR